MIWREDFAEFIQDSHLQSLGAVKISAGNIFGGAGAEDVFRGDAVDNFAGREAVDLAGKDMVEAFGIVGENFFERGAAVEALDDFGDKHAGFHVGVEKFLVGIVEDSWVFAFESVDHFDNDVARRKDLAGTLRRDEVENIFVVSAGEIIGELVLAAEKFENGAVENFFVEEPAFKMFAVAVAAVAQENKIRPGNAGDFEESFFVDVSFKIGEGGIFVAVSHEEAGNSACEAAKVGADLFLGSFLFDSGGGFFLILDKFFSGFSGVGIFRQNFLDAFLKAPGFGVGEPVFFLELVSDFLRRRRNFHAENFIAENRAVFAQNNFARNDNPAVLVDGSNPDFFGFFDGRVIGGDFFKDADGAFGGVENVGDFIGVEEVVAHEAAVDGAVDFEDLRQTHDFFGVERRHFAVGVF